MQRMWRQMFAAVLGVVALAGTAAAQSPPPRPLPPIIPVAAPVAAPAYNPGIAIPQVMPAAGRSNGGAAVRTEGPGGGVAQQPAVSYGMYNPGCNNGCGSVKHDLGFMFGSCKSFFDPCGPKSANGCGGGRGKCGGGLFGHGSNCPDLPWGTPYGTGHSGCRYDSWLNH